VPSITALVANDVRLSCNLQNNAEWNELMKIRLLNNSGGTVLLQKQVL